MTVEYALTRMEIVHAFFLSVQSSSKYRTMILVNAAAVGALVLLMRVANSRSVGARDVLVAAAWGLGALVFMPLWLFIRGKTGRRTLTISPSGIYTEIGRLRAQVPWRKIKLVKPTEQYILIAKLGGNSFFIPHRAFSRSDEREQFLADIGRWIKPMPEQRLS